MTKLDQLNALIEANSLKNIIAVDTCDNHHHFTIYVKFGSYAIAYGTYTQTEAFIKGFRQGLTESKQLQAYDIHF
jgi:hypothetical protein